MNDSIKLVSSITVICLISAFLVSLAHEVTLKPIADAEAAKKTSAILAVLPEGAENPQELSVTVTWPDQSSTTNIYWSTNKGYAMEITAPNGYSGDIKLMLGFSKEGNFWSYKVLAHSETPGLGGNITGSFLGNVKNRPASGTNWKVVKDGGDIVPITAATISSRAVCGAIDRGVKVFETIQTTEAM